MSRSWVIGVICLFLTAPLGAHPERLGLSDIFEFESASDPQISPDGSQIVYVRNFADVMSDRRYSNLWICSFDGSGHRPLTSGMQNDVAPRWSSDGGQLIYVSSDGDSTQIVRRWMDTGQTARVTHLQHPPSGLAWSPDDSQISFTALVERSSPGESIAKLPAPPKGAKWAAPAQVFEDLEYRFDGTGYHPYGYTHIFVVPADGGTARQITHGNFHFGRRNSAPVWTPDGRHLIVSANLRDPDDLEPLDSEVWEISVATGEMRPLTSRRGPDNNAAISPDGKQIAYLGFDDQYQGYQRTELFVMNRDGSQSRSLSADLDRSVRQPQWAADSSGIYALYDDQGVTKLAWFDLDGSRKELARDIGRAETSYSGGSFTVANNNRVVLTLALPDVTGELAVLEGPGHQLRRITRLNDDLLEQRKLGSVEEIWYPSSHDQRQIHGWIIYPPDFDPARKWPLILEIHGGPFANYGPRFDLEKQLLAAAGYVVLYVNPRGSTSYGREFGNLIHHAYPGDDFYDLDSGVDALLKKGYIDEKNLFVTGGSGGGVLTAWMVGRTDRFRAAVSVYPVINWTSWLLTADLSAFGLKYWFPGLPWDHPEHYESRSLLSVVKNVKTPTMLLTGEADYRTPMSESEQYFQALKLLGVESVLVRVPDEPHGIRVRPSHHVQKVGYIQGWFDKYRTQNPVVEPSR